MKYALVCPCDQTIAYVMAEHEDGFVLTTKHPEALLLDTREAAQPMVDRDQAAYVAIGWDPDRYAAKIYEVEDEAEFRSRKDTW